MTLTLSCVKCQVCLSKAVAVYVLHRTFWRLEFILTSLKVRPEVRRTFVGVLDALQWQYNT